MQKQAPTVGRILVMVFFALSCFGLLLYLWMSFGGATPLKPQGYRFQVAIPRASQLAVEADVRAAGVAVGRIREKERAPGGNRTLVTIELDRRFAPLNADAKVIQRSKTLLGEKYLEITPGTQGGPTLEEGGRLPDAQVTETVELDQILNALDPETRRLFRSWQQELGTAVNDRGQDLNDAFGNLPRFAASADDLLKVLDSQEGAVSRLVRNTGEVFEAITEREDQLRNLVVNTDEVFEATARQRESLADIFQVFPTFLDESRRTAVDLESFSRQARPLVRDLRPAMRDLRPAVRDLRAFAPDLQRFYRDLDPLITASRRGLPALSEVLRGLRPLLGELQPFLEELNPILEWLEYHQMTLTDFFSNGGGALVDTLGDRPTPQERGHYLGQFGLTGQESVVVGNRERGSNTRGNAYPDPSMLSGVEFSRRMMIANWDCSNTGKPGTGEHTTAKGDTSDTPSCWVKRLPGLTRFPQIKKADYSRAGG